MNSQHGRFIWYELLSTDTAGARKFYGNVLGWSARDASTADFAYSILIARGAPVCGLMDLPAEGQRMGARPRWVGYVAVEDTDAAADLVKHRGGAIYVPPTDSNIGRISIVADPQTATLAMVQGLKLAEARPRDADEVGCVGWHELFATDSGTALAFYADVFGWQDVPSEPGPVASYRLFSAGGDTIGGMFNKLPRVPVPFWVYYFNVADLDRAMASVKAGGGQVVHGPMGLPGGFSIARCVDPQGAMFALRGPRGEGATGEATPELSFSAAWGGFASQGRVVVAPKKPKSLPKSPARPKR
ncbi:VOC family protein [Bradyrhizobium sp.]|uniref:VOC family protein n=1 Tax=Bradyrhizobium sp. TaxID=376 RepID=UPI001EB284CD|nr:VOC family protein [Bradyrhizobium sp.]MBV9985481.1 VOC family protein [Bradyrhizobium sp.]